MSEVLRVQHKPMFDTLGNTSGCHKVTDRLASGTAIQPARERLRTVADGCEHKRNVEQTHPRPKPQSEMGTLGTHVGKRGHCLPCSGGCNVLTKDLCKISSSGYLPFGSPIWILDRMVMSHGKKASYCFEFGMVKQ